MKVRLGIVATILLICASEAITQDTQEYIVAYEEGLTPRTHALMANDIVLAYEPIFKDLNLWSIKLQGSNQKAAFVERLSQDKRVRYVHENLIAHSRLVPNDPEYQSQWSLPLINMPQAWDLTTGGPNAAGHDIVVGILDDGFEVDHADLNSSIWVNAEEIADNGLDDDGNGFIDDVFGWNARAMDDNHLIGNHGTSVAGIIGAASDNGVQMAGINWDVKLMLTSSGRLGEYTVVDIVKSYEYIYEQRKLYNETRGAQGSYVVVTNYSGGISGRFPVDAPAWCDVFNQLGSVGIINIGSTDNDGVDVDEVGDLPSTCPSDFLIVVTNSGRVNEIQQNAGFGDIGVDLAAPGDDVLSLSRDDGIDRAFFGTSASAPHVAGVISLMYSLMCDEAYEQSLDDPLSMARIVKAAIMDQVTRLPDYTDITVSGGVLNALASLELIDETLGNCCEINIDEVLVQDESCMGAQDGIISVQAIGEDLNGPLQYNLSSDVIMTTNELGNFNTLSMDSYTLTVSDIEDPLCKTDTTFMLGGSIEVCPFGSFEITNLRQDETAELLTINYDLDEQKDIRVQIHDSVGRLIYSVLVRPSINDGRFHDVSTSEMPAGIYHASILANGVRDVSSFRVVR